MQGAINGHLIDSLKQSCYFPYMLENSNTRAVNSVRILCDAAADLGIERMRCLEGSGISETELYLTSSRVTLGQEIKVIENFVSLVPDARCIGIHIGKQYHVNTFGIWGFAILSSPTLRAAIQTAIDYSNLSSIVAKMSFSEDDSLPKICFDTSDLPDNVKLFAFERHSTVTLNFVRELFLDYDVSKFSIEITCDDQDYARIFSEFIGLNVICGQPVNALVVNPDLLDKPLPKSDPVTLEYCINQCKALLEQQSGILPEWSQKVRDVAISNMGTEIKIDTIARKLAVTERTLRRRLTGEGTSFREIYTDARLGIAFELLETTGLTVQETAWRVGYAEPAAFVRAFVKKYGKSPGTVRNKEMNHIVDEF